jgi:AraC-like DNA-binding protein
MTGRPKIEIDINLVKNLCEIQCTGEEIASVLGISYDTLERRIKENEGLSFADFYKKNSETGKMSLRRAMFKKAVGEGNVTMLIWLSKQHLGMKDGIGDDDKVNYDGVEFVNEPT